MSEVYLATRRGDFLLMTAPEIEKNICGPRYQTFTLPIVICIGVMFPENCCFKINVNFFSPLPMVDLFIRLYG